MTKAGFWLRDGIVTESSSNTADLVECRLCGHKDTPDFCSQCGLPLRLHVDDEIITYIWDRILVVATTIPRFIWTTVLLVLRPRTFFETLNADSCGPHQIRVLRGFQKSLPFEHWRRPTTPHNYFLFAILLSLLVVSGAVPEDQSVSGMGGAFGRLRTVVDIRLPTAPRRNPFSTVSRACQTAR